MKHRPACYTDWRAIWQQALKDYGGIMYAQRRYAHNPASKSFLAERERLYRQLVRLERRLDAEFEAMDRSCAKALLEMILDKETP